MKECMNAGDWVCSDPLSEWRGPSRMRKGGVNVSCPRTTQSQASRLLQKGKDRRLLVVQDTQKEK